MLSAGLLAYRKRERLEMFLVHPGGPYFRNRDSGAWSIPKGIVSADEDPLAAAFREFEEEVGVPLSGHTTALGQVRQRAGKVVRAWAIEADFEASVLNSNLFQMEWPPKSGRMASFPEVDRGEWFDPEAAAQKILPAQAPLLERLVEAVSDETQFRFWSRPRGST